MSVGHSLFFHYFLMLSIQAAMLTYLLTLHSGASICMMVMLVTLIGLLSLLTRVTDPRKPPEFKN